MSAAEPSTPRSPRDHDDFVAAHRRLGHCHADELETRIRPPPAALSASCRSSTWPAGGTRTAAAYVPSVALEDHDHLFAAERRAEDGLSPILEAGVAGLLHFLLHRRRLRRGEQPVFIFRRGFRHPHHDRDDLAAAERGVAAHHAAEAVSGVGRLVHLLLHRRRLRRRQQAIRHGLRHRRSRYRERA